MDKVTTEHANTRVSKYYTYCTAYITDGYMDKVTTEHANNVHTGCSTNSYANA